MKLIFVRTTLLAFLVCGLNTLSLGQTHWPTLQKISLKERALQRNLSDYAKATKAQFLEVRLDKQDSLYHYYLTKVYFFERIKRYARLPWGRWGNYILLFTSKNPSDLNEILSISDTCSFDSLVRYARPLLSNQFSATPVKGGLIQHEAWLVHGLDWDFVIKKGQELWFRTSDGFDSRDFPQPK
jgi:hypothetical protein